MPAVPPGGRARSVQVRALRVVFLLPLFSKSHHFARMIEAAPPPPPPPPPPGGPHRKALVTGFEPFAGDSGQPGAEALARLPGRLGAIGASRPRCCRRCSGRRSRHSAAAIETTNPGHRPLRRSGWRARRLIARTVAINIDDARIPDNAERQPVDCAGGHRAVRPPISRPLPIKAAVAGAARGGPTGDRLQHRRHLRVQPRVLWPLHLAATRRPGLRGGFLHVPYLARAAKRRFVDGAPPMALGDMVRGIEIAAERSPRRGRTTSRWRKA